MKRKVLAALILVGALAAMPALAFGAGSKGSSSGGGGGSSSSSSSSGSTITVGSGTTVTVDSMGVSMTVASTAPSQSGSVLGVVTSGTNAEGKTLTTDSNGNMVIGGEVTVVIGQTADGSKTAGLPEAVVAQFNEFDTTKSMASVLPQTAGYTVQDDININLYDANGVATTTPQVVPVKWSGLTAEMQNLLIGYYDNMTGQYVLAEIVGIDYDTQVINIRVSGSGTARILAQ